jgi:O-antigen/teichoic acid export membrane protein
MSLAARIGRAIFWGQAGRFAEASILFFFSLLLARVLGPASYGLYALGMSLAGVCGFLTLLGLGPETLGRFLPEISADRQRHRANGLLRALLAIRAAAIVFVACLVFIFHGVVSARLHFPLVIASLAAVLAVFAARSILDLFTYFSCGLLELRRVALAKVTAAAIAPALFVILLTFRRSGVNSAWLAFAGGSLAGIAILAFPLFGRVTTAASESFPLRRMFAFGMFTWATNFFVYVLGDSTDVLLLGWLVPDRAAIGRYAVGAKIVFSLTGLLLGWASLVSVASFSESYQRAGIAGLARAVEAQWKLGVLCVTAPFLLLLRYAGEIVTTLYSADYAGSVPVTRVLCGLMACAALLGFSLTTSALYVIGRERLACGLVGGAAVFNVVAEIFLVRRAGILGAAWATGMSFVLLALASGVASRLYIPWRAPTAFTSKVFAASALALAPTLWIHSDSILRVGAGCVVYAAAFVLGLSILKPLDRRDSAALGRVNARLGSVAEFFSPRPLRVAAGEARWQE